MLYVPSRPLPHFIVVLLLSAFDEFGRGYYSRGAPNIDADCDDNYFGGGGGLKIHVRHCLLIAKSLGQEAYVERGSRSLSYETIGRIERGHRAADIEEGDGHGGNGGSGSSRSR